MLHLFILIGHTLGCFTSSYTGSSLLGMFCNVSLLASLVHHYLAWFVLSHVMLHWFNITGHGLHRLTTPYTGSSLLGMVCIASLHASLVPHYWA
jgi:hypothetical protein